MASFQTLWQRLFDRNGRVKAEVERIGALQQAAVRLRAEYASKKEQAAQTGDGGGSSVLSSSRKRMEEAEFAHIAALQVWENKQARQKSY
ncbi:MAG: hypothetical protein ACLQVD_17650 [Capsulimonadaceae bacterium]